MPDWKRLSSGQNMLLAFGAAILAVVVNGFVPFLSTLLVILAIILFLLPIFLYRSTGTTCTLRAGNAFDSASVPSRWVRTTSRVSGVTR